MVEGELGRWRVERGADRTSYLARAAKRGFPRSLADTPMLLPVPGTTLRREIDQWLEERGIVPQIVGEFEDPALMSVFAQTGKGLYVARAGWHRMAAREEPRGDAVVSS